MMSLEHWLKYGIDAGFCSEAVCESHQGLPTSEEEMDMWDAGEDPCVVGVRIYREGERPCG